MMKHILLTLFISIFSNTIYAQDIIRYKIERTVLQNLEETEEYENMKAAGKVIVDFSQKRFSIEIAFEDEPEEIYHIKGIMKGKGEIMKNNPANVKEGVSYFCRVIMDDTPEDAFFDIEKLYNGMTVISIFTCNGNTIRSIYTREIP